MGYAPGKPTRAAPSMRYSIQFLPDVACGHTNGPVQNPSTPATILTNSQRLIGELNQQTARRLSNELSLIS